MIFTLSDNSFTFPDPALAEENGLLAIGGDLQPERLISAYQNGIFPWFSEGEPVCWFSPHERCVIFPDAIKISKSMQKLFNEGIFKFTTNAAFGKVIEHCSNVERKGQDGTWISGEMKSAYTLLHKMGVAHSVEVWQNNNIAGGLYGVVINNVFCGESMFSLVSNASKAALIWLCSRNYKLIDCQIPNDHLFSMGAEMISRNDFMKILQQKM